MSSVLLIEENDGERARVRDLLVDAGYAVDGANTGAAGLRAYRHHRSDVVITDMLMENTDGVETILALRQHDPDVKIIATSTGGRQWTSYYLDTALSFGALRTLRKPVTADDLLATVAEVLVIVHRNTKGFR